MGLTLGVAGITEAIPIVGPAIGAVPALSSAFVSDGQELALLVAGVIMNQLADGQILVPVAMKNAVGLWPYRHREPARRRRRGRARLIGPRLPVPVAAALVVMLEHASAGGISQSRSGNLDAEPPEEGEVPARTRRPTCSHLSPATCG